MVWAILDLDQDSGPSSLNLALIGKKKNKKTNPGQLSDIDAVFNAAQLLSIDCVCKLGPSPADSLFDLISGVNTFVGSPRHKLLVRS